MVNFLQDLVRTGDTVVLFQVIGLLVAAAVACYLCGCFNGAVIVSKYILRNDVRNHGSGNAGLTNFYRVFGGPLTVVVILTDAIKMVVAVEVGQTCVAAAVIAHIVPKDILGHNNRAVEASKQICLQSDEQHGQKQCRGHSTDVDLLHYASSLSFF